MKSFIKIYQSEQTLLERTNSLNAYKVYYHLKQDNSYFKGPFMDMQKYITESLNMPERTLKECIKRLKAVGLIETKKKGKVNWYTLPYANGEKDIEETQETQETIEEIQDTTTQEETLKKEDDMGTYIGTTEELMARSEAKRQERADRADKMTTPKVQPTQMVSVYTEDRETDIIKIMDSRLSTIDKQMALRQTSSIFNEEKNIQRLSDRLDIFLNGFSTEQRKQYYTYMLKTA